MKEKNIKSQRHSIGIFIKCKKIHVDPYVDMTRGNPRDTNRQYQKTHRSEGPTASEISGLRKIAKVFLSNALVFVCKLARRSIFVSAHMQDKVAPSVHA